MKIKVDMRAADVLKAKLRGLSDKKIRVAAAASLNAAVYYGSGKTKDEVARVFDRVTPWVVGGVTYRKARADKLEASIDLDKWGNKQGVAVEQVLDAEIFSGRRRYKRFEIALQRVGILPRNMAIVPGPGAPLDRYGNMPASIIVQIMAWFRSFGEQGYRANMTDKTRQRLAKDKKSGKRGIEYFALGKQHGKLRPGIYRRTTFGFGSAVSAIMYFVPVPTYRQRLRFYEVAESASIAELNRAMPMYLNKLLDEAGL